MATGVIQPASVYEDGEVLAFKDIRPAAPIHLLVIPKRHISTLNDLGPEDAALVGRLFLAVKVIAAEQGFAQAGYRAVMNCNADGGQSVFHIHLHVLAGFPMGWPPFPPI
jgi:histidine triad (HIT) family protein